MSAAPSSSSSQHPSTLADTQPMELETKLDKPGLAQMLMCSMIAGKPTQEQLKTLEQECLQNNRNRGLTGVLLCGNGVFVHWLEGLDDYLQAAFKSIAKDPRHDNIVVLWHSHAAADRLFGDWVMGLRNTIVAQDLLAVLQTVKRQQTAKAMLSQGYFEVFSDTLRLLERVCMVKGAQRQVGFMHEVAGPAIDVLYAMGKRPFRPYTVEAPSPAKTKAVRYNELSSLNADASSIFKNSMPAEHTALFDRTAEGNDDLITMLDMPLRWALGKDLWARRKILSDKPLHWTYEGKLVVVMDHKTWRIGLHPELTSASYEDSVMIERLGSANDIPSQFRHTTAYALFWDYAESDLAGALKLPERFKQQRIRLHRPAPVPAHALTPVQQQLQKLMTTDAARLVDLAHAAGLTIEQMARELLPFYAARCIEAVAQEKVAGKQRSLMGAIRKT